MAPVRRRPTTPTRLGRRPSLRHTAASPVISSRRHCHDDDAWRPRRLPRRFTRPELSLSLFLSSFSLFFFFSSLSLPLAPFVSLSSLIRFSLLEPTSADALIQTLMFRSRSSYPTECTGDFVITSDVRYIQRLSGKPTRT